MEKWPRQMARLMFNKDVTAYTLGYTFLTPIWGPSSQIRFFKFLKPSTILHQSIKIKNFINVSK